jgi:hypothetical protein
MHLAYENGTLRVENAAGLRWQLADVAKPQFSFEYDALSVNDERAVRQVGPGVHPLGKDELKQVRTFVEQLQPPAWASFQKQMIMDLRVVCRGLINTVVSQLEYDGLLDVMMTGREGSTDLHVEEARRVMAYVDSVWNAFHALAAQITNTPAAELKTVKEYAAMIPYPLPVEHFSAGVLHELLHDTGRRG